MLRRWSGAGLVVGLGCLTGVAELILLVAGGLLIAVCSPVPRARRAAIALLGRGARSLADQDRRRLRQPAGPASSGPDSSGRVIGYLSLRWPIGLLGAVAAAPLAIGGVLVLLVLRSVARGDMSVPQLAVQFGIGAALLYLNFQAIAGVAWLDAWLFRSMLGPSDRELLERRVAELSASRAGIVAAVDTERRRIERDLHDGVQQRLVALGMLLGRARRSPDTERAMELVRQAHEDAQRAIEDLREVAWRVYPSALDHASLDEVLSTVAARSSVPVRITCDLPVRPSRQIETVLYFLICEAITNAAKHSGADLITVDVRLDDQVAVARIRDDGAGGADPAGSGLTGLAGRVAAYDGRLTVDSPPGGPTVLTAVLPCG